MIKNQDILRHAAIPMRYMEFQRFLAIYIQKTTYKHVNSMERALLKDGSIQTLELKSNKGDTVTLYSSMPASEISAYQTAVGLCRNGYFCNLTSMYYHELTNQVPKTIYMATENIGDYSGKSSAETLSDHDIFSSFVRPSRVSRNVYKFREYNIILTERVKGGDPGVEVVSSSDRVCPKGARVSSLERGLIDAIVHPQYNGGISSVLEFYRAGAKRLNAKKMLEIYKKLNFKYPYWQAIGFICDRAGIDKVSRLLYDSYKPGHKFYLDHHAKESWVFDSKWSIFYPKGLF